MSEDKLVTRRQKDMEALLWGLGKFAFFCLLVALGYRFGVEPFMRPEENQDILMMYYNIMHFHPTLLKVICLAPIPFLLIWRYKTSPELQAARSQKKRLKEGPPGKAEGQVELPTSFKFDQDMDSTWQQMMKVFPGLTIEIAGLRSTHWRKTRADGSRHELHLSLSYDRMSSAQAAARPEPRILHCAATVKGSTSSSTILLSFKPEKMIEDRYIGLISAETGRELFKAIQGEMRLNLYGDDD